MGMTYEYEKDPTIYNKITGREEGRSVEENNEKITSLAKELLQALWDAGYNTEMNNGCLTKPAHHVNIWVFEDFNTLNIDGGNMQEIRTYYKV